MTDLEMINAAATQAGMAYDDLREAKFEMSGEETLEYLAVAKIHLKIALRNIDAVLAK